MKRVVVLLLNRLLLMKTPTTLEKILPLCESNWLCSRLNHPVLLTHVVSVLYLNIATLFKMSLFITFWLGWLVSFLGQLPLGTMSITATQIAVSEGFSKAWKYSIGVAIIEIAYVRLTVSGVAWIVQHNTFFEILNWLTVVLFLGLGTATFISALKQQGDKKPPLLNNRLNRFALGVTMSALNPAQVPFWFVWSSYLINLHALGTSFADFNTFCSGCGLGTISGLAVYMYGGNWLIVKMKANTKTLNIIMGVVFIIAALAQLYRIFYVRELPSA